MRYIMKEEILEEIMKECNWWERIIIRLLTNIVIKVYTISRLKIINNVL